MVKEESVEVVFGDDVVWVWDGRRWRNVRGDLCRKSEKEYSLFDGWDILSANPVPKRLVCGYVDGQPFDEFFVRVFHIGRDGSSLEEKLPGSYRGLVNDRLLEYN
jgi:hypothetical protein